MAISDSAEYSLTYNVANQRTKKVAGGVTTYYVYGIDGLLYGEYNTSGVFTREYVYLNGQPLAQIDAGSPEVLTYLHVDHLGTPRFGTNTGGSSVWAWANDAFGISTPTGSRTVNLRMPGQYADSESGNFYNWNRYYKPSIGRYISSDPIGVAGGLNTFNYAEVSPAVYSDPMGLETATVSLSMPLNSSAYPRLNEAGAAVLAGTAVAGTAAIILPQSSMTGGTAAILRAIASRSAKQAAVSEAEGVLKPTPKPVEQCPPATTAHGAERVAGAGATRGGVLSALHPFILLLT